jgi:hypothetical protein
VVFPIEDMTISVLIRCTQTVISQNCEDFCHANVRVTAVFRDWVTRVRIWNGFTVKTETWKCEMSVRVFMI